VVQAVCASRAGAENAVERTECGWCWCHLCIKPGQGRVRHLIDKAGETGPWTVAQLLGRSVAQLLSRSVAQLLSCSGRHL